MSLRYSFWSKMVVVPVVNYCHSAPNQAFTSPSAPVWWCPVNTWSSVRWPRLTLPVELSLHGSNEHPSPGSCRAHGPAALGGIAHSTFLWAASPSTLVKAFPASFQNTERLWGRLLLDHQRAYFQWLPLAQRLSKLLCHPVSYAWLRTPVKLGCQPGICEGAGVPGCYLSFRGNGCSYICYSCTLFFNEFLLVYICFTTLH